MFCSIAAASPYGLHSSEGPETARFYEVLEFFQAPINYNFLKKYYGLVIENNKQQIARLSSNFQTRFFMNFLCSLLTWVSTNDAYND